MADDKEMHANYAGFTERILNVEKDPRTELLTLEGYANLPPSPISTDMQRYNGIVRSISYDLAAVRERVPKVPPENLSKEESATIYLYTMGKMSSDRPLYMRLNDALRAKNRTEINPYFSFLKLCNIALAKLESVEQTIYCGIKADVSEKYPVGKAFVWSGFSSCTTSGQMLWSEDFLGKDGARTFFKINCSSGKNIRQHSSLPTEDEIVLLPGTKFKVISKISPSSDLHIIEIQEIVSSNLSRQRFPSISKVINDFDFIEPDSKQIHESKNLLNRIEEERNKTEGEFSLQKLNDEHVFFIANEIKTNNHWKILKLNGNKIGNTGMAQLSSALVLNSTLETLFLDDNYIGDYGIRLLSDTLMQNFTLVSLTLAGNQIQDLGAKTLAELLRTNSTLTELSLEENIIGDNGMIDLCEILEQYNRTLKKLWVNNNSISDKSVEAIVAFRTMNHVLEDFRVDGNRFSRQALHTIQAAEKKHQETLKTLSEINAVIVVYLELKCIPEKRLSRDASFLLTNFRRLLTADALDKFTKKQTNSTTYLILYCEDELTIRMISSFCSKRKVLLYVLRTTTNENTDKNANIFNCEEAMMFRLATRIAHQYRSMGDQIFRRNEKDKARVYFQQGIDIQQRLVNYLKKRRINQNDIYGTQKINPLPEAQTTKSLILSVEN